MLDKYNKKYTHRYKRYSQNYYNSKHKVDETGRVILPPWQKKATLDLSSITLKQAMSDHFLFSFVFSPQLAATIGFISWAEDKLPTLRNFDD